jgi:hypothetical protein
MHYCIRITDHLFKFYASTRVVLSQSTLQRQIKKKHLYIRMYKSPVYYRYRKDCFCSEFTTKIGNQVTLLLSKALLSDFFGMKELGPLNLYKDCSNYINACNRYDPGLVHLQTYFIKKTLTTLIKSLSGKYVPTITTPNLWH